MELIKSVANHFSPVKKSKGKEPESQLEPLNLLVKEFQEKNITIYGTYDKPMFKAMEIGELLGIANIRTSMKTFTEKDRVRTTYADSLGRNHDMIMLTERGVYKLIMKSKKEFALQFQDWICDILEELRKTGEYNLRKQLEEHKKQLEEKEQERLELYYNINLKNK